MFNRRVLHALQWLVSVSLVCYLLTKIDLVKFVHALKNVNVALLSLSIVQLTLQPILGAWRWQITANMLSGKLKFPVALRIVWIGIFFGQALPGSVGADLVRIWLYYRERATRRLAVNSVALERMIMVLSLVLLVALVQPGLLARSRSVMPEWVPSLLLMAAVVGIVMLIWSRRFLGRFGNLLPVRAIGYLSADLQRTLQHPFAFAAVTVMSMLAYVNMAITAWLIAAALGLPVSLHDCIVLIPMVTLIATIPVSIGGWGLREGAMMVLFGSIGVSGADAVTLSVLFGVAGVAVSLPGIALWLSGGHRRSELESAAALVGEATASDKPNA